jgi:hypothetical protein
MTRLLSIDPGGNTGIVLGHYDAVTPYSIIGRWQVHGGLPGFLAWWERIGRPDFDELVVEKFILDPSNAFSADLTPVLIEGAIIAKMFPRDHEIAWQPRTDKAVLTGYPPEAVTKAQRQRVRFDFLKKYGMFVPGTNNDDGNDAVVHALVYLKRRRHAPTLQAFWPQWMRVPLEPVSLVGASF